MGGADVNDNRIADPVGPDSWQNKGSAGAILSAVVLELRQVLYKTTNAKSGNTTALIGVK
jgi:hypothetical protein